MQHTSPQHVLLVEDSRTQALRIQLELARHGVQVEIAASGETGILLAQQHPQAIILDIDLPDMTGYQLCAHLKQNPSTASIPVVMLTHRDAAVETIQGLRVGAEDYIPKDSFAEQNLLNALRQLGVM